MNLDNITTIIFDLGGVVLDIDYHLTQKAFEDLGLTNFQDHFTQAAQSGIFDDYEIGAISSAHFINKVLEFMPEGTNPNKVVHAWNAMIKEIPAENLTLLKQLREKYQVIALSNTNELHIEYFEGKLRKHGKDLHMTDYFDFAHYSSQLGMRKPNPETFQHVCDLHKLDKTKTLFIDDTIRHINGAEECGLNTFHFTDGAYKLNQLFS